MTDSVIENHQDIIMTMKENQLKNFDELNVAYNTLAYPFLVEMYVSNYSCHMKME
jgi:hypothetical protein